jgi:hypothetical protein
VYTPCIHGETILASKATRQMDMGTCRGYPNVYDTDENGDQAVCGGRRMIYIVCRYCGKHDLVPKCVNELELCFSCIMDVVPYD